MVRPAALNLHPPLALMLLGGIVASLLLTALTHLAPILDLPFIDVSNLIGGVFTADENGARWLGFWIYFLLSAFLFAPLLRLFWNQLPGEAVGIGGALLKGTIWRLLLWIVAGLLLPLAGMLNRLSQGKLQTQVFLSESWNWGHPYTSPGAPRLR